MATGGGGPCPNFLINPDISEIAPRLFEEIPRAVDSDTDGYAPTTNTFQVRAQVHHGSLSPILTSSRFLRDDPETRRPMIRPITEGPPCSPYTSYSAILQDDPETPRPTSPNPETRRPISLITEDPPCSPNASYSAILQDDPEAPRPTSPNPETRRPIRLITEGPPCSPYTSYSAILQDDPETPRPTSPNPETRRPICLITEGPPCSPNASYSAILQDDPETPRPTSPNPETRIPICLITEGPPCSPTYTSYSTILQENRRSIIRDDTPTDDFIRPNTPPPQEPANQQTYLRESITTFSNNEKTLRVQILKTEHINRERRAEQKHDLEVKILEANLIEALAKADAAKRL